MNAEKVLSWLMMIVGCGLMVAFLFMLLPPQQMASMHEWLGLGELPDAPITFYLARSTSMLYGIHGALMFICGRNVKKHADLMPVFGWLHFVIGVVMIGIDVTSGMPWWWTTFEGAPIAATGLVVVWLSKKAFGDPS
ncbi:hypothetical protein [Mariniblastus fucicola]|nr:hypothetical protein [Mariniblastus fucicola]